MKKPTPIIPLHQRQLDFARTIAAAEWPQESRQSWQYVAQRLARQPEETAFAAAINHALAELEGAR